MDTCWLSFSVFIGTVRCTVLKKASWLKKRFSVFGFCVGWWAVMVSRSNDNITPIIVIVSAPSLIGVGMVSVVVVCSVDSLVIVPAKIEPSVRRMMGLMGCFVSW